MTEVTGHVVDPGKMDESVPEPIAQPQIEDDLRAGFDALVQANELVAVLSEPVPGAVLELWAQIKSMIATIDAALSKEHEWPEGASISIKIMDAFKAAHDQLGAAHADVVGVFSRVPPGTPMWKQVGERIATLEAAMNTVKINMDDPAHAPTVMDPNMNPRLDTGIVGPMDHFSSTSK